MQKHPLFCSKSSKIVKNWLKIDWKTPKNVKHWLFCCTRSLDTQTRHFQPSNAFQHVTTQWFQSVCCILQLSISLKITNIWSKIVNIYKISLSKFFSSLTYQNQSFWALKHPKHPNGPRATLLQSRNARKLAGRTFILPDIYIYVDFQLVSSHL